MFLCFLFFGGGQFRHKRITRCFLPKTRCFVGATRTDVVLYQQVVDSFPDNFQVFSLPWIAELLAALKACICRNELFFQMFPCWF